MNPETPDQSHQGSGVKGISLPEDELAALKHQTGNKAGNVNDQRYRGNRSGRKA